MPNTPSTVHEGMAGVCAGAHAGEEHLELAEDVLRHLGAVVRVPERSMDAVTAVSGSGPAYFALLAEAMIEAGILLGLSREISTQLVVQTMLGTAKQLRDEEMHPVELREMVTSPGWHDDRRDPRARAGRRPRRVPERDPGRHEPLARARRRERVIRSRRASPGRGRPAPPAGLRCASSHIERARWGVLTQTAPKWLVPEARNRHVSDIA